MRITCKFCNKKIVSAQLNKHIKNCTSRPRTKKSKQKSKPASFPFSINPTNNTKRSKNIRTLPTSSLKYNNEHLLINIVDKAQMSGLRYQEYYWKLQQARFDNYNCNLCETLIAKLTFYFHFYKRGYAQLDYCIDCFFEYKEEFARNFGHPIIPKRAYEKPVYYKSEFAKYEKIGILKVNQAKDNGLIFLSKRKEFSKYLRKKGIDFERKKLYQMFDNLINVIGKQSIILKGHKCRYCKYEFKESDYYFILNSSYPFVYKDERVKIVCHHCRSKHSYRMLSIYRSILNESDEEWPLEGIDKSRKSILVQLRKEIDTIDHKLCSNCLILKERNEENFGAAKKYNDGLKGICKGCVS